MGFKQWLIDFLGIKTPYEESKETATDKLAIALYADEIAVQKIARTISKCELVTFEKNKRTIKDEWYLWNIEPNANQNGAQFKYKIVERLLKDGEALIVEMSSQLFVADSFDYHDESVIGQQYFDGVTINNWTANRAFNMSEVLYLRLDNPETQKWLQFVLGQYEKLLSMSMAKYKRSGGRKGFMRLSNTKEGSEDKNKQIENIFNERLRRYYDSENAILVLNRGMEYTPDNSEGSKRTASEVNDINSFTREMFARTAQARSIPLPILLGENENTSESRNMYFEETIMPILNLIDAEIKRKRFGKSQVLQGTYAKFDISGAKHVDVLKDAEKLDKAIACGALSIDDALIKAHETPLGTEWSEAHFLTKNYQLITTAYSTEGGENGE